MIPADVLNDAMGHAKATALKLTRFHPELRDDAIGDAMLGVARALAAYDPALIPIDSFGAYACIRARGAVLDGMRTGERKRQYRGKGTPRGTKRPERNAVTYSADLRPQILDIETPGVTDCLASVDDHATRFELRRTLAQLLDGAALGDRERFILRRLAEGATNAHIGRELGISETRVNQVRNSGFQKIRTFVAG
jgi:RNA polymerase sigma factor (sigma-70 family)